MFFDTQILKILALYLHFEGAKNIQGLYLLIWGFCGGWRVLAGVLHLGLDMVMVTGFYTPIFQILALYLDFKGAKTFPSIKVIFGALEDTGRSWGRDWGWGWGWVQIRF